MSLEYWYLFPVSIGVATLAMASGIGGAVFFSPIFLLWLKLEPTVAIGIALITEFFGFSSGLIAYVRARLVDYRLGANLLMFSVPGAIVGVLSADLFPGVVLKTIFAVGLIFIGLQLFLSWRQDRMKAMDELIEIEAEAGFASELTDRAGNTYRYTVCNTALGRTFAAFGGAFLGMISVGLAELQEYHLVARCKVPSPVAVATSIFVVVITGDALDEMVNVAMFTVPGVLIGGQLGPRLQARVNPDKMKVLISWIFMGVGAFMLSTLL
ncbi:MAG: sulfite exporter TauE/SafE family protein [Deltaproteobacteria bacterium]|nr:sulfite exporter TauE/SafE family protein [Deltaproteobacteria bacterium]